jgi:hypothetical protein
MGWCVATRRDVTIRAPPFGTRQDAALPDAPEPRDRPPPSARDLVEYFVVVFPDRRSLGSVVPALREMVESARIRVLDIVVLDRDGDGRLDVVEITDLESLAPLAELDGDIGLLSENDLHLAGDAVRPGEAGLVLVAEDRWAEQLSVAAREAGGHIVAGERIPSRRVEAALADRLDTEGG